MTDTDMCAWCDAEIPEDWTFCGQLCTAEWHRYMDSQRSQRTADR